MNGAEDNTDNAGPGAEARAAKRLRMAAAEAMTASLAAQSWAQADAGVARAWRESLVLERALEDAAALAEGGGDKAELAKRLDKLAKRLETIEGVAFLLRQEIESVARLRGLELVGEIGDSTAFDPDVHNVRGRPPALGDLVRIVAPGVALHGRADQPLTPTEVARLPKSMQHTSGDDA